MAMRKQKQELAALQQFKATLEAGKSARTVVKWKLNLRRNGDW